MDWIVQFDPPDDPRDYIHRVGRTARGANKGRSLMFLQPSEIGFLKHLKEARIPLVEFEFPSKRIMNIQPQLEKLIGQNYYLNKVCRTTLSLSLRDAREYMAKVSYSQLRMDIALTFKRTRVTAYDQSLMYTSWT